MKVGFYFNCYKNYNATDNVLKILRKHYPDNPVFLMNDHGDDLSELARKYNCFYYYSPINILGGRIINDKRVMCFSNEECARHYLKVILKAIKYCKTEYLILMEDDVLINGQITHYPKHAGGDKIGNYFRSLLKNNDDSILYREYPKIEMNYWNLAGGSILNSKTMKECIKNTKFEEIKKFDKFCNSEFELWHTNDVLLNYILMINGKTAEEWTNTDKSNIIHPYKKFYDNNLGINEGVYRK